VLGLLIAGSSLVGRVVVQTLAENPDVLASQRASLLATTVLPTPIVLPLPAAWLQHARPDTYAEVASQPRQHSGDTVVWRCLVLMISSDGRTRHTILCSVPGNVLEWYYLLAPATRAFDSLHTGQTVLVYGRVARPFGLFNAPQLDVLRLTTQPSPLATGSPTR
jgi:hypothetical protein